ncbi:low molecular weight protein-tyrosine-phosphatase [Trueperella pecoris]|uniref:low molecular weight protein-tyrosine-phosphatase n=1 Tax=Trueperella pecoris TaxID=2733571 RepID=UPI00186B9917|nr:low molecular weight protein-tyrosine-phosphatase [Trueperella pecoris]QOQ39670.1 low molecular weight phosphotyrosine protein phosphatase [Trueperella pecoris]QTG75543.1 low molecular weight phosphotyrosine protein phosphatase [Trueperella pecoris]
MYRILVVCTGNICRSPMGEVVLRDHLAQAGIDDVEVRSAGVSTEETGNPIDRRAQRVLLEKGHSLPPAHHAHRASDEELRDADLILAMTTGHAHSLRAMLNRLGESDAKLHLWREFDGTTQIAAGGVFGEGGALSEDLAERSRSLNFYRSSGEYDVPDPWYGDDEGFYETYDVVDRGARGIVTYVEGLRS